MLFCCHGKGFMLSCYHVRKFQLEKVDVISILQEYKHLTKDRGYVVTRQLQRLYILARCRVMIPAQLVSNPLRLELSVCVSLYVSYPSIDRSTSDASLLFSAPHLQHREKRKP